jgi:hypothetical protein
MDVQDPHVIAGLAYSHLENSVVSFTELRLRIEPCGNEAPDGFPDHANLRCPIMGLAKGIQ